MTSKSLEIKLLYYSNQGREVSFTDISQGKDSLDLENYESENFWATMGGFEITIDGHLTIFHSSDFHYLVKATSFLIHSLYWIKNETSDWFDKDDEFPKDVIIKSTGGNIIRLTSINENELSFSYSHASKDHINVRGDRFFEGFTINKTEWFKQADLALDEYFIQLRKVIAQSEKPNRINETMHEYYQVWTKTRF